MNKKNIKNEGELTDWEEIEHSLAAAGIEAPPGCATEPLYDGDPMITLRRKQVVGWLKKLENSEVQRAAVIDEKNMSKLPEQSGYEVTTSSYDRFDLEQELFKAWHIIDDIEILSDNANNINANDMVDALKGLRQLYHWRFEKIMDIYEDLIKTEEL